MAACRLVFAGSIESRSPGQTGVEVVELIDHAIDGKGVPHQRLAPCSQTPAQGGIPGQEEQAIVQTGAIAGGEEEARFTVEADFAGSVAVERDHRFAGGEGLGQRARQTFASREVHKHVHDPDGTRDLAGRNQAREHKVIGQTQPAHTVFESLTPEAVPDQEKLEAPARAHQIRSGGNQVVVSFQFEQPRHFPDHDVVRGQSQAGAPRRIRFGGEVGIEADRIGAMYGAAKSGLFNFVKSLALAGGPYGVRAVCVSPGPVLTRPGMSTMATVRGTAAQPDELVNVILYLCGDDASFVTGTNILVDGGHMCVPAASV